MSTDFDAILTEYGPLLSRVATSYEANAHLRQELLQEISLAVWQALQTFRQQSSIKTYILRVAHNKAVNHVTYHSKIPLQDSYCETEQPIAKENLTLEQKTGQDRQVEKLLEAVRQLPIQTRQVVTMSMEGLSYQEIADVCGLTSSNVGVTLNRAKKALMERIQHAG